MKRTNDADEIFEFLQLITIIANDHHRIIDFFNKIEIVLLLISDCIKEKFSNHEIFNIFRYNKRLLLILIENSILSIDEYIINFFLEKRKPIIDPEINITEEKYEHALLTDDEKSESDEEESEEEKEKDESEEEEELNGEKDESDEEKDKLDKSEVESDEEIDESEEESDEIIQKLIVIILVPLVYQKYQFHQQS